MPNTVTLAVTAYNEMQRGAGAWLRRCIQPAIEHSLVQEIVIVDDASEDFGEWVDQMAGLPKVRVYQNEQNRGILGNKLEAVRRAASRWVALCDSDNVMGADFYDCLAANRPWCARDLCCPSFARPEFDYQQFIGRYDMHTFPEIFTCKWAPCLFNTGNQFFQREIYLNCLARYTGMRPDLLQPNYLSIEDRSGMDSRDTYDVVDSSFINKEWLIAGGHLNVLRGLEYQHHYGGQCYEKAPELKCVLMPLYLMEIRETAAGLTPRSYCYQKQVNVEGRTCFQYSDGLIIDAETYGQVQA